MADDSAQTKEPLDVGAMLLMMVEQLAAIGWSKLGLQPDLITGQIAKDLEQAKLAIDALASLAAVVEANLEEDDRRQVQRIVRDLRLNYVEKHKEAHGGA